MPVAAVHDAELFYVTAGKGRPCLVLHGGLGLDHTYRHPRLGPPGAARRAPGPALRRVISRAPGFARVARIPLFSRAHTVEPAAVSRYSRLGLTVHWLMAVLVLIAFIYGPGGSETRVYSAARDFDRSLHETLGLAVLALALVRVAWRLGATVPEPPPVARWMTLSAKAVQGAMYVLFFALPATAIAGAWLEGHPLTLLAGVEIGPLLPKAHRAGAAIAELHTWLGDAILWLAGLHAAAALYHHFMLRDGVLVSMLPRRLAARLRGAG